MNLTIESEEETCGGGMGCVQVTKLGKMKGGELRRSNTGPARFKEEARDGVQLKEEVKTNNL